MSSNLDTPIVTECEIHWVVKLLESTVSSGRLTEKVLDTFQFEHIMDNPWDAHDPSMWVANYSMDLWDAQSGKLSTFGLSNTTALKTYLVWAEIAPSSYVLPAHTNHLFDGPILNYMWNIDPRHFLQGLGPTLPWDTPNNVTQHMADAVKVMNQVIRRNSLSERNQHEVVIGKAWVYLQFVEVKWAWISMPLSLLLISGIFLAATITRSPGTWKTPPLATVFNDLDESSKNDF